MRAGVLNPVILLDEIEKVSETRGGMELAGVLTHLTDSTQNDHFIDRYFSADLPLDLSRALIVCTCNDLNAISPILRDRLSIVQTGPLSSADKIVILRDHILPRLLKQFGLDGCTQVSLTDAAIARIIQVSGSDDVSSGVRHVKRMLTDILSQINLARLMRSNEVAPGVPFDVEKAIVIGSQHVDSIIRHVGKDGKRPSNDVHSMMYV
jgi:ATP-dependent Lon protease